MPKEFNILTLPTLLALYSDSEAASAPKAAIKKSKMPTAKYKISITEEVAVNAGDSPIIKSFFSGEIKGQKKGQGELYFAMRGSYDDDAKDFSNFNLIIVGPLKAEQVTALSKCGGSTETFIEGTRHADLPFKRIDGRFVLQVSMDCLAGAVQKDVVRQIKFLTANFQDVAINIAKNKKKRISGHNGLEQIIQRIALGEIVIASE